MRPRIILLFFLLLLAILSRQQAVAHHVSEDDYWNFEVKPLPNADWFARPTLLQSFGPPAAL